MTCVLVVIMFFLSGGVPQITPLVDFFQRYIYRGRIC